MTTKNSLNQHYIVVTVTWIIGPSIIYKLWVVQDTHAG